MSDSDLQIKPDEPKQRPPKMVAEKALPKSGADTLVKIVKGYAVASNGGETQINYKDVASAAGISPTVVSANNSFLLDSQILTSPKYGYYVPSEGAVRFAREAAWDEAGAKAHLRRLVISCWYGQVAIQNFTLRATLTRTDLKRSLAIKSGATEGDSTSLEFLLDFIVFTGLVSANENGSLSKGNFDEVVKDAPALSVDAIQPSVQKIDSVVVAPQQMMPPAVSLVLHLHIHKMDELTPEHAARIGAWLKSFAEANSVHVDLSRSEEPSAVD